MNDLESIFLKVYSQLDPAPDLCSECGVERVKNFPKNERMHDGCTFSAWVERAFTFWSKRLHLVDLFFTRHPGFSDMKFADFLNAIARGEEHP